MSFPAQSRRHPVLKACVWVVCISKCDSFQARSPSGTGRVTLGCFGDPMEAAQGLAEALGEPSVKQ